jgi:hypothetical protein
LAAFAQGIGFGKQVPALTVPMDQVHHMDFLGCILAGNRAAIGFLCTEVKAFKKFSPAEVYAVLVLLVLFV